MASDLPPTMTRPYPSRLARILRLVNIESERHTPICLLGEVMDSAMLCQVFVKLAERCDSPSPSDDYELALEQIELVIDYLEEAQELVRLRLADGGG